MIKITTGRAPTQQHVVRVRPQHAQFADIQALLAEFTSQDTQNWTFVDEAGDACMLTCEDDWDVIKEARSLHVVEVKHALLFGLPENMSLIRLIVMALTAAFLIHPHAATVLIVLLLSALYVWRLMDTVPPVWQKKKK